MLPLLSASVLTRPVNEVAFSFKSTLCSPFPTFSQITTEHAKESENFIDVVELNRYPTPAFHIVLLDKFYVEDSGISEVLL